MGIYKKKIKPDPIAGEAMLRGVMRKLGFDPHSYALFELWDRLLGKEAEKARAVGLAGTALCVEVDSSARLSDLTLRKRNLLRKMNEPFGGRTAVSDIIFRLAARGPDGFYVPKKPKNNFNAR